MRVYIRQDEIGVCAVSEELLYEGIVFINAPDDIISKCSDYAITSQIDNGDGTWTGEFKLREEIEFPYSDKPIRVELTASIFTSIALDEEKKTLLDKQSQRTDTGVILWFTDFVNNLMTPEETETYFTSLGAVIKRKI
jgi:hypothetical protein